ncbi:MAG: class I SAM-dependent methyltransferase [Candidatus Dojkabacteria bacterium]
MSSSKEYWNKKLIDYAKEDWSAKPSIFAEFAVQYFPEIGKILELASGVGQDGRFFAGKGYGVTQTDFSETSLEYLELLKGLPNIKNQPLDMSKDFPFEKGSFDVVYCHLGIHYFDKRTTEKIFSEINRVLKGGGVIALLVNSNEDPEIKESDKIEDGLYRFKDIQKRYFSIEDIHDYAKSFEILIADNQGTTYKDTAMGVSNLIRFIGRKSLT